LDNAQIVDSSPSKKPSSKNRKTYDSNMKNPPASKSSLKKRKSGMEKKSHLKNPMIQNHLFFNIWFQNKALKHISTMSASSG
jgi:hypothetical protein